MKGPEKGVYLDRLRMQEQDLRERHEEMVRQLERNPKDSGLRMDVDRLYDEWSRVRSELSQQIEGGHQ